MHLEHFDIAYYAGHRAFLELRRAYELYKVPVAVALARCGIEYMSIDPKPASNIGQLAARTSVPDLLVDAVDDINAFHWSTYLDALRTKEAEFCLNAAIFLQVMMEAVVNDALGSNATGKFADKWQRLFDKHNAPNELRALFDHYLKELYRGMRNKVVHPSQRYGIINAEKFRFFTVHGGFRAGWSSFVFLLNETGGCGLEYESNWTEMCTTIHQMPSDIDEADFPDMLPLARGMLAKHLDAFNARLNK